MRKMVTMLAATLLALSMMAGPGSAHEKPEDIPPHGHLFVHRPVVERVIDGPQGTGEYMTGFRKCVELPVVPLRAHHAGLHTGTAGDALFDRAGHVVIPTAPLSSWATCADFEDALPLRVG